jgi:hypothetical protein
VSTLGEKVRKLNQNGVKDSANMWRTFDGEHYGHWAIYPSGERISAYRAAGIKCRRIKDELFVRQADEAKAVALDASTRWESWS